MGSRFNWMNVSAGFAREAAFGTPNTDLGDYRIFPAAIDGVPTPGRTGEDVRRKTGQFGSYLPTLPGGRDGSTFTVQFPWTVGLLTYDAATGTFQTGNGQSPFGVLVANFLGSRNSNVSSDANLIQGLNTWIQAYAADGVASAADASHVTVKNPTPGGAAYTVGNFVATCDDIADPTRMQYGFIKSKSGDALTLSEDAADTAQADDSLIPSWTAALTAEQQIPMTWQFWGIETAQLIRLAGCMASEVRLICPPGKTPMCEIDYISTDMQWIASGGGLQVPADLWELCAPMTGEFGARVTVAGAVFCGIEEFQITITADLQPIGCASGIQGVTTRDTRDRRVEITFLSPEDTDNAPTDGNSFFEYGWIAKTPLSVGTYVGNAPGRIAATWMPLGYVFNQPTLQERNGALYWQVTIVPGIYSGDGASTGPGNSVFRVGGA